jgi:hypothetical protein
MKKDVKINKGRFAVIKKNGKILQTIEAVKGLRIEGGDDMEVISKYKKQLTGQELAAIKSKV